MTDGIRLELLSENDAQALFDFEHINRDYFERMVPSRGDHYYNYPSFMETLLALLDEQREGKSCFYLIKNKEGQILGRINVVDRTKDSAELGYRIGADFAGQGVGSQALALLLEQIADKQGISTLHAKTPHTNIASQKILLKNGFTYTKTEKASVHLHNSVLDFLHYEWKGAKKIRFPKPLSKGDNIGVTAPSSGVEKELHHLLVRGKEALIKQGYHVIEGETIWTQVKARSASKERRAKELMDQLLNPDIKAVIPPWGGELAMEILPLLDWDRLHHAEPTWIIGYSDTSTYLFCLTLLTGLATVHGNNYVELGYKRPEALIMAWDSILASEGENVPVQYSSAGYQSSFSAAVKGAGEPFYYDQKTEWKAANHHSNEPVTVSGRLIGGCMDTLRNLIGTRFAPVNTFAEAYAKEDGLLWYLESCQMAAADLHRTLWQMDQAGWFKHAKGIIFGRPSGYSDTEDLTYHDVFNEWQKKLDIPIIYDADVGHQPPQMLFVNGARGTVSYENGKGSLAMTFS